MCDNRGRRKRLTRAEKESTSTKEWLLDSSALEKMGNKATSLNDLLINSLLIYFVLGMIEIFNDTGTSLTYQQYCAT